MTSKLPIQNIGETQQILPKQAYTSPEWFQQEVDKIFSRCWTFVGVRSEFESPGDYISVQAGNHPLFAILDHQGEIKAYHNICRHRGAKLLEGNGCSGKHIQCPYHRWVYKLNGDLRGVPNESQLFGEVAREELGLHKASIEIYRDLVFIHPDENPKESFSDWLAAIPDYSWPHEFKDLAKPDYQITYEMDCNWKVFYENAIDGYHLAYLHDKTLMDVKPPQQIWETVGQHHIWYKLDDDGSKHVGPDEMTKHMLEALQTEGVKDVFKAPVAGVYMLFPTTNFLPSSIGFSVGQIIPVAADKTLVKTSTWFKSEIAHLEKDIIANMFPLPGIDLKPGEENRVSLNNISEHPLESGNFQIEDMWVVEGIQQTMKSDRFKIGPLSYGAHGEGPLKEFQEFVLAALNKA